MAAKTPIEEELDPNEDVIKTGILDWVVIFFEFIWFMRRVIVGCVLLAGLLYGIYKVWMIPPQTFDEGPALVVETANHLDKLPKANIDFAPLIDESFGDDKSKRTMRRFDDIALPEEKEVVTYDPLFETGTADELIEAVLKLRDGWAGKDEPIVFLMNQRRAKLTRRLMELDINEDQQLFSLSEYIESIIVLDMVVCRERMKTPEVRVAIEEVVEMYYRHPYPTIRAKASLARVSIPLHDYAREQRGESLDSFASRLAESADQVFEDSIATARLGAMVLWLRKFSDWDGTALPYCVDVLDKMQDSRDPEIRTMGTNLRERIYFEHLEPNDLVARLDQGDKQVRPVIQEFFQGIDANPNSRLVFFQVAVSVIEKFKALEQKEDYEGLLEWLKKISTKVTSEAKKAEILSAIDKLEALVWGPLPEEQVSEPSNLPDAMRNK